MEVYRFKVGKKQYAYALLKDAKDARDYFIDQGYPKEMITEIDHVDETPYFQFKMENGSSSRSWR